MSRYRQTFTEAMQQVALTEKEVSKLKNGVKVLGNALPNRALAQKMADKANKEMGKDADVYQSPFNNRFYVRIKEAADHEISMARGELEAISDKALKLSSILQGKTDDAQLEAWVQSKITKAKDYINSVSDYMEYNPDNANEELEESFSDAQIKQLKKEYEPLRGGKISISNANKLGAMFTKFDKDKNALEKLYGGDIPFVSVMAMTRLMTKHNYKATDIRKLGKIKMEEVEILDEATQELVDVTEGKIDAKKFDSLKRGDTMSITYNSTMGGKSTQKFVVKSKSRSAKYNTDKVTMYPDGKPNMSRYFLYKRANGDVSMATGDMAASIMSVEEFTESVEYVEYMAKNSGEAGRIANMFKGKTGGGEIHKSGSEVRIDSAKNIESIHKQVVAKFPDTNVMTVEDADLEEGMMSKIDAMQKDGKSAADIAKELKLKVSVVKGILGEELDEMKKDDAYAIGMAQAKKSMNDEPPLDKKTIEKGHEIAKKVMKNEEHPAKAMYEQIKGLKNKAEKSGMPYGILKKVYDRGMAAWRGGHRPGASQQQWAFARVNSFVTKSSGTWGGADKDLAKQVKKESLDEASLYAFKEYEPGLISNQVDRDMKNIEDAIKRAGGRIKSKEKPTRREPNMSFEIETGNPTSVKAAIKKADPEVNVD